MADIAMLARELRGAASYFRNYPNIPTLCTDAADELEKLRAALTAAEADRNRYQDDVEKTIGLCNGLIANIKAERDTARQQLAALVEALDGGIALLEVDDCEVGDDVWLWLHEARELSAEIARSLMARALEARNRKDGIG